MTIPAYSLSEIEKLKPCENRFEAARGLKLGRGKITARMAVEAGVSFDDLLWVASAIAVKDIDVKFRLTGWMADVAAHVLHIFEKEYPTDMRPRQAIKATHQFIRGKITEKWAALAAGAAEAAEAARAAEAAGAAERQWQTDRLVYWLSEEKPKFWPLPKPAQASKAA